MILFLNQTFSKNPPWLSSQKLPDGILNFEFQRFMSPWCQCFISPSIVSMFDVFMVPIFHSCPQRLWSKKRRKTLVPYPRYSSVTSGDTNPTSNYSDVTWRPQATIAGWISVRWGEGTNCSLRLTPWWERRLSLSAVWQRSTPSLLTVTRFKLKFLR